MASNYFMPTTDNGKADLLDHLAISLTRYASQLDISDVDLAGLKADADGFRYILHVQNAIQAYADKFNHRETFGPG